MTIDPYAQIRREITSLWDILRKKSQNPNDIDQKISNINNLALHIGGKVQNDADQLTSDIRRFLIGSLDRRAINRMFRKALELEQETREL